MPSTQIEEKSYSKRQMPSLSCAALQTPEIGCVISVTGSKLSTFMPVWSVVDHTTIAWTCRLCGKAKDTPVKPAQDDATVWVSPSFHGVARELPWTTQVFAAEAKFVHPG